MRHLQDYAEANGLTELARRVAASLEAARSELQADGRRACDDRDPVQRQRRH
jgi:hypothetical protein